MNDSFWQKYTPTPLQAINADFVHTKGIKLFVKREDLIHPAVQGNKWRKLKHNFLKASTLQYDTVLTFGGAYSNHIAATAAAGRLCGCKTIGIIRGEELDENANPTLKKAAQDGMRLVFVRREDFRDKDKLAQIYDQNAYVLPEGGSNSEALVGVGECAQEILAQVLPTHLCTAVGTGGTAAGLLAHLPKEVQLLAFSSLKISTDTLKSQILQHLAPQTTTAHNLQPITQYHFGGYGRYDENLLAFMHDFEQETQIPIEQVYTAKMFFGLYDLIQKDYFAPNSIIVALHTGGLQGRISR